MSTSILQPNLLEHLETLTEEEVFLYLCEIVNFEPTMHKRINLSILTDDDLTHLCQFNSRDLKEIAIKLELPQSISTLLVYFYMKEGIITTLCSTCELYKISNPVTLIRLLHHTHIGDF